MLEETKDPIHPDDAINKDQADSPVKSISVEEFMNLTRFGAVMHLRHVLEKNPELVNGHDAAGNGCLHWAARRGDVEIFTLLTSYNPANIFSPTTNETSMYPIHWAVSQGNSSVVKHILSTYPLTVNLADHANCTPFLIAIQYNHTEIMIALINTPNVDLFVKDSHGDGALHWAAYKGHETALELLMGIVPQTLENEDNYGQTPLHLATMKGHSSVTRRLITKYSASTRKRDRQGQTALDHAVAKGGLYMEVMVRLLSAEGWMGMGGWMEVVKGMGKRAWDKRVFAYLFFGMTDLDQGKWMWRVICLSNGYATYCTIQYIILGGLVAYQPLLFANIVIQLLWWGCFLGCLIKEPGYVENFVNSSEGSGGGVGGKTSSGSRGSGNGGTSPVEMPLLPELTNSYSELLSMGYGGEHDSQGVQLCHTCKLRRPLRAKHDRATDKCVLKFDHFCPYVYNVIGRDNYKYFFSLLLLHPLAYASFMWTTYVYYQSPHPRTWWFIGFLVYSSLMLLMMCGLLSYHLRLVLKGVTTNEDIGIQKYSYMWTEAHDYSNPFQGHGVLGALAEVYAPDQGLFYSRQEVLQAKKKRLQG